MDILVNTSDNKQELHAEHDEGIVRHIGKALQFEKHMYNPFRVPKNLNLSAMLTPHNENGKSTFAQLYERYQPSKDIVIGIDVSPGMVRLCELKINGDKWDIITLDNKPVSNKEIIENPSLYTDAIAELVKEHNPKIKHVACAIPSSLSIVKTLDLPLMEDGAIKQAIALGTFWDSVADLTDETSLYSIHWEVIKRDTENNTMDMLFVAAKDAYVEHYTNIIKNAGLEPTIVDIRCFALYNALHSYGGRAEPETGTAYLKIDEEDHYLQVLDEGESFLYELLISDEEISNLENLLTDNDFIKRISAQVKQFISSHEAVQNSKGIKQLHILATTKASAGLARKMGAILTCYEIDSCNVTEHINLPEGTENHAQWAVVIGLAMRRFDPFDSEQGILGADNINLMPDVAKTKQNERIHIVALYLLIILSIIAFAGALMTYIWLEKIESGHQQKLDGFQKIEEQYNIKNREYGELDTIDKNLKKLDKIRESLPVNQPLLLQSYKDLSTSIPKNIWLRNIKFKAPTEMTIEGNALSDSYILEFIRLLNMKKTFKNVSLKDVKIVRDNESRIVKQFSMICELNLEYK